MSGKKVKVRAQTLRTKAVGVNSRDSREKRTHDEDMMRRLERARRRISKYVGPSRSFSDELISDRRADAKLEMQ